MAGVGVSNLIHGWGGGRTGGSRNGAGGTRGYTGQARPCPWMGGLQEWQGQARSRQGTGGSISPTCFKLGGWTAAALGTLAQLGFPCPPADREGFSLCLARVVESRQVTECLPCRIGGRARHAGMLQGSLAASIRELSLQTLVFQIETLPVHYFYTIGSNRSVYKTCHIWSCGNWLNTCTLTISPVELQFHW